MNINRTKTSRLLGLRVNRLHNKHAVIRAKDIVKIRRAVQDYEDKLIFDYYIVLILNQYRAVLSLSKVHIFSTISISMVVAWSK